MLRTVGVVVAAAALSVSGSAMALTNLVQNGSFEQITNGYGELGFVTNVVDWTEGKLGNKNYGEAFVFAPGTADKKGLPKGSPYGTGQIWGPGDGSNNNLTDASPDGGNFVSMSGGLPAATLSQTIAGLKQGGAYVLTFDFAFDQSNAVNKSTVQTLYFSLGNQTETVGAFPIAPKGFSGWMTETFTFKNFSGPDVLSFLADGTDKYPPFALLDGVQLTATGVPEPAAWTMMLLGVFGLGALARRRRGAPAAA